VVLAEIVNSNAGWWAFLALPPVLVAAVAAIAQIQISLRTRGFDSRELRETLLRVAVSSTPASPFNGLDPSAAESLPVHLQDHEGRVIDDPISEVINSLRSRLSVQIIGQGGAGKTSLAYAIREKAIELAIASESAPIVEVIPATELAKGKHWLPLRDRTRLVNLTIKYLKDRYRVLSSSKLQGLIDSGILLLAVDGIDEITTSEEAAHVRKLIQRHSQLRPILILRRPSSDERETEFETAEISSSVTYMLLPITLEDSLKALQAGGVIVSPKTLSLAACRLLQNPLKLHIFLKVCAIYDEPMKILAATNPEQTLWDSYIATLFDQSISGLNNKNITRTAHALALRSSAGWNLMKMQYVAATKSDLWCLVIIIPILTIVGYKQDFLSHTLVLEIAIIYSLLQDPEVGPLAWVSRFIKIKSREFRLALSAIIFYSLTYLISRALQIVILNVQYLHYFQLSLVRLTGGRLRVSVSNFYNPRVLTAWWSQDPYPDLVHILRDRSLYLDTFFMTIWLFGISLTSLSSPQYDPISAVFKTFRFPRWISESIILRLFLASPIFFYLFLNIPLNIWPFAALSFACIVARLPAVVAFVSYTRTWPSLKSRTIRRLARERIIFLNGKSFRFLHDEVALALARQGLADPADRQRFLKIVQSTDIFRLADDRVNPGSKHTVRALLDSAGSGRSSSYITANMRAMFLCFCLNEPSYAASVLHQALRRRAPDPLLAQYGEVLMYLQDRAKGMSMLDKAYALFPGDIFVVNRYARWCELVGRLEDALASWRHVLPLTNGDNEDFAAISLLALELRHSSDEMRPTIIHKIRKTAASSTLFSAYATLEVARIETEDNRNFSNGLALLNTIGSLDTDSEIVAARLAVAYFGMGEVAQAQHYARLGAQLCKWSSDPRILLEVFAIASIITEDPESWQVTKSLLSYGLELYGRRALAEILAAAFPLKEMYIHQVFRSHYAVVANTASEKQTPTPL